MKYLTKIKRGEEKRKERKRRRKEREREREREREVSLIRLGWLRHQSNPTVDYFRYIRVRLGCPAPGLALKSYTVWVYPRLYPCRVYTYARTNRRIYRRFMRSTSRYLVQSESSTIAGSRSTYENSGRPCRKLCMPTISRLRNSTQLEYDSSQRFTRNANRTRLLLPFPRQ